MLAVNTVQAAAVDVPDVEPGEASCGESRTHELSTRPPRPVWSAGITRQAETNADGRELRARTCCWKRMLDRQFDVRPCQQHNVPTT